MFPKLRLCCVVMVAGVLASVSMLFLYLSCHTKLKEAERLAGYERLFDRQAWLINELQKERGMTVSRVAADDKMSFQESLVQQYRRTDLAIDAYREAVMNIPVVGSAKFNTITQSNLVNLAHLREVRPSLLEEDDIDMILEAYTGKVIENLLSGYELFSKTAEDAELSRFFLGLSGLSRAKESAGLMRANGGYILGRHGPYQGKAESAFHKHRAEYGVYTDIFRRYAPISILNGYDKIIHTDIFARAKAFEAEVANHDASHGAGQHGHSAHGAAFDWFELMTEKIDFLLKIEKFYLMTADEYLKSRIEEAKKEGFSLLLIWFAGTIFWLGMIVFVRSQDKATQCK